jgi:hypothetical protein
MKHKWQRLAHNDYRCENCFLDRAPWPILKLWRPWPFNNCTSDKYR